MGTLKLKSNRFILTSKVKMINKQKMIKIYLCKSVNTTTTKTKTIFNNLHFCY